MGHPYPQSLCLGQNGMLGLTLCVQARGWNLGLGQDHLGFQAAPKALDLRRQGKGGSDQ